MATVFKRSAINFPFLILPVIIGLPKRCEEQVLYFASQSLPEAERVGEQGKDPFLEELFGF